jgi:hypothetical protein
LSGLESLFCRREELFGYNSKVRRHGYNPLRFWPLPVDSQTAEQAALENVPLSGLEKRMMYFTEKGECPEDPIALNDAFA